MQPLVCALDIDSQISNAQTLWWFFLYCGYFSISFVGLNFTRFLCILTKQNESAKFSAKITNISKYNKQKKTRRILAKEYYNSVKSKVKQTTLFSKTIPSRRAIFFFFFFKKKETVTFPQQNRATKIMPEIKFNTRWVSSALRISSCNTYAVARKKITRLALWGGWKKNEKAAFNSPAARRSRKVAPAATASTPISSGRREVQRAGKLAVERSLERRV